MAMPRTQRSEYLAVAFVLGAFGVPGLTLVFAMANDGPAADAAMAIAVIVGAFLFLAACIFLVDSASPPAPNRLTVALRLVIVCLAWLSPAAVVAAVRLSQKVCTGLNLLGLPWHPGVAEVVHAMALGVPLISLAALIYGFTRPLLRRASVMMTIFSIVAVIPTALAIFMSVYGDPGPDCVPV